MSLIPPTRTPIAVLRSVACGMGEQVGLSEQVFWFSEWNACPELRRRSVWGLIEANPIHSWRQVEVEVEVEVEVMVMVLAVVAENESSPAVPAPPPFALLE